MSERSASTFRLASADEAVIAAPASGWARLTNADAIPSWNSTVTQVEGPLAARSKLAIQVPVAPGRTPGCWESSDENAAVASGFLRGIHGRVSHHD